MLSVNCARSMNCRDSGKIVETPCRAVPHLPESNSGCARVTNVLALLRVVLTCCLTTGNAKVVTLCRAQL